MEEIEFIDSIGKLDIKENDIIVLKVPKYIPSREVLLRLQKTVKETLPEIVREKVKILVLEGEIDIGVIRCKKCDKLLKRR